MKRVIALTAATLLASSAISFAQLDDSNGNGIGASDFDSSQDTTNGGRDSGELGVFEEEPDIGQETTAAIGDADFDRAMSLIGSRDFDLASVEPDTDVQVISLSNVSEEDRQALEAAMAANQQSVDELRTALASRQIEQLDEYTVENAVAAEVNVRNELVVYVR